MEDKNPNRDHKLDQGIELVKKLKFEEAIEILDEYLEVNPINLDAWYFKATAFHNLHQYEEEIQCYDKIVGIKPDEAAWYNKGFALGLLGRYSEAIDCYENLLEINPKDRDALEQKSLLLRKQKNKNK